MLVKAILLPEYPKIVSKATDLKYVVPLTSNLAPGLVVPIPILAPDATKILLSVVIPATTDAKTNLFDEFCNLYSLVCASAVSVENVTVDSKIVDLPKT